MDAGKKNTEEPLRGSFTLRLLGKKFSCYFYHNAEKGKTVAWTELLVGYYNTIWLNSNTKIVATASLHKDVDLWDGKFGYLLAKFRLKKAIVDRLYVESLKEFKRSQIKMAEFNVLKTTYANEITDLHNTKYPR